MRRNPMAPSPAPRVRPERISRRQTRHQSRQGELLQGQGADDQRRGLRARVAAAADDERHEEGEDHGARDLVFVVAHGGGGEHLAEEERGQPAPALLHHRPERDLRVGRVQRFEAAHLLDVLGGLRAHGVQHRVHGQRAHELAPLVHHRRADEVVARERLGGGRELVRRLEHHRVRRHEVRDRAGRLAHQQRRGWARPRAGGCARRPRTARRDGGRAVRACGSGSGRRRPCAESGTAT